MLNVCFCREFQVLFRDVSEGFNRSGLDPNPQPQQNGDHDDAIEFLKTVDRVSNAFTLFARVRRIVLFVSLPNRR